VVLDLYNNVKGNAKIIPWTMVKQSKQKIL